MRLQKCFLTLFGIFLWPSADFAFLVSPEGFEPPTNRTGICHSIQLNYGD